MITFEITFNKARVIEEARGQETRYIAGQYIGCEKIGSGWEGMGLGMFYRMCQRHNLKLTHSESGYQIWQSK